MNRRKIITCILSILFLAIGLINIIFDGIVFDGGLKLLVGIIFTFYFLHLDMLLEKTEKQFHFFYDIGTVFLILGGAEPKTSPMIAIALTLFLIPTLRSK